MDEKTKKAILKLYDMVCECRRSIEELEDNYDSYSDSDTMLRCRELKELGFDKMEIREILGILDGTITQIVNSVFEEE